MPLGEFLEEVRAELRDVFLPLAQGRQPDRADLEPVVQVLAEPAGLDLLLEVPVRGRDDPHVHLDRVVGPDADDLAVLQHAQQLGLE